ncbi:MAG: hypothetical protein SGILL_010158 [Bacillariaceae sp.]
MHVQTTFLFYSGTQSRFHCPLLFLIIVVQDGNPGFISETTGKPANLFHVVFDDQPNHPYASHLLDIQDFEEYEIQDKVIEGGSAEEPNKKKQKKSH